MSTVAHDPIDPAGHGHGGTSHDAHGNGHAHSPHLAHHFDTPEQQFSTSKLGMWTFLATEVLMFGGLFCAYAVYRYNHPEVYLWAHRALDPFWGMVNTIVLLASSFTMAWGVRAAQLNQRGLLQLMLILTFLGGVIFMCVKGVEYKKKWEHYLFPGHLNAFNTGFNPGNGVNAAEARQHTIEIVENEGGAPAGGEGSTEGRGTTPVSGTSGKDNTTAGPGDQPHVSPTNPQTENHLTANQVGSAGNYLQPATSQPVAVSPAVRETGHNAVDGNLNTPDAANIRPPTFVPAGINPNADTPATHHWTTYAEMEPTDRAQLTTFFSIYFMMTGLHGVHVLVGMGLMAWLFVRSAKGDFSSEFFTPVDLTGLYWHLVDLIWIFLFPLLYLIH